MEIEEFKAEKAMLETEIRAAIELAIEKFNKSTGYTPRLIEVNMIDAACLDEDRSYFAVGEVTAAVEL